MEPIRASGMSFWEGGGKFFARGASYGPFRPNPLGEPFPEKTVAERDFALLRRLGANTLRLYHVPPPWLVELAAISDLRLLVGIPWAQHVRFLDSAHTRRDTRLRIRRAAESIAAQPNLLGLLVGNEISPQILRWYGAGRVGHFVSELVDEVRQAAPEALVSYASYPMTEYLELEGLDFASFNVYLHRERDLRRYLARLQNRTAPLPLLVSELGVDSMREGERVQAEILERSLRVIAKLGCAGGIVFAFTDEWHTGGLDVGDWAFGLVSRERERKAAFAAVQGVFRAALPPAPEPAPRVSVVVCAYQAERTLDECLASLRELRYPDFEVIVVDDGSTDSTRAIAQRNPEFRLVALDENAGLSNARNQGILAASGEIVAFTDADCAADPDWLTLLVQGLRSGEFAGVGGPNLPPPEDDWLPEVVARAPGGPTHVLVDDEVAEHVPGCNMAFWRDRLLEVGMFDPLYRAAGDDVDLCWRLQDAGYRIGFAAGALVWHRRRHTIAAYLRQQRGYGHAEGLLYFKHPHRFNRLGSARWLGRIYSDLGPDILSGRPVVYAGPFGLGLFQTLYEPPASLLRYLPVTLEWNALGAGLTLAGLLGRSLGAPLTAVLAAGLGMLAISLLHALHEAWRVDARGLPSLRARATLALLAWLGPLDRAVARSRRLRSGRAQGRKAERPAGTRAELDLRRRSTVLSYWNETGIEKEGCLATLVDFLRLRSCVVIADDGWRSWDLSVSRGISVRAPINILVEEHGPGRSLVAVGTKLRQTLLPRLAKGAAVVGVAAALAAGAWSTAGLLVLGLGAAECFLAGQAWRLARAVHGAVEAAFAELSLEPLAAHREREAVDRAVG